MKDKWYGDNRDLIKWGTLLELASRYESKHILQVLYYRPSEWEQIEIDGTNAGIAKEVIQHFRNVDSIRNLVCPVAIEVLQEEFSDRTKYLQAVIGAIQARRIRPGIIFLDPDTGLQPPGGKYGPTHVLDSELGEVWRSLEPLDVLVFYQHQTNRAGDPWIESKKSQFAKAIGSQMDQVKHAHAPGWNTARDVAFFFLAKQ